LQLLGTVNLHPHLNPYWLLLETRGLCWYIWRSPTAWHVLETASSADPDSVITLQVILF